MSDLIVTRYQSDTLATLSRLSFEGRLLCYGLELPWRANARRVSCIPAGRYPLRFRRAGGFHERYARKFPHFHKGMIEVCDVPGRDYILIHTGNYPADTNGCLLIGQKAEKGRAVWSSVSTYKQVYPRLAGLMASGDLTHIDVREEIEPDGRTRGCVP